MDNYYYTPLLDNICIVWRDCKISRAVGISISIVGGIISIVAGVSIFVPIIAAPFPLFVSAGVISGLGGATTIGTKIAKKVIKSKKFKEAENLLGKRRDMLKKVDKKVGFLRQILKIIYNKGNSVKYTFLKESYNPNVCDIVIRLLSEGGQVANSAGNLKLWLSINSAAKTKLLI